MAYSVCFKQSNRQVPGNANCFSCHDVNFIHCVLATSSKQDNLMKQFPSMCLLQYATAIKRMDVNKTKLSTMKSYRTIFYKMTQKAFSLNRFCFLFRPGKRENSFCWNQPLQ